MGQAGTVTLVAGPTPPRTIDPAIPGPTTPDPTAPDPELVVRLVLDWYDRCARDLPWRRADATPWSIMVSEFMLQQTPVERVRAPWRAWLDRWPDPDALAAAPAGDAVRAWGRLGYPRRALRLHQAARVIADRFGGVVPAEREDLLSLPGVGSYTAAAIASFAYGLRETVLDTNVRRVLARIAAGQAYPEVSLSRAEIARADAYVPVEPARAARWAAASMELGAVVCTARSPRCDICPVSSLCTWWTAGQPAWTGPPRRGQSYAGTDRQCRGALLGVLRSSDEPVAAEELAAAWPERTQRDRALASLVSDGLVVAVGERWALPG